MRIKANVAAAIIGLCVSSGWAADAYEVAGWAPAEAVAVMAWAGAEQASQGFPESRLGQLWAEPTIQRFLKEPASSGWAWLSDVMAEKSTLERATMIQGLLSQLWHQPVMICAFPVEKSDEWPLPVGIGIMWRVDQESDPQAKAVLAWLSELENQKLPRSTIEGLEFTRLGATTSMQFAVWGDKRIIASGKLAAAIMAKHVLSPSGYAENPVNRRSQQAIGGGKPFYYSCFDTHSVRAILQREISLRGSKTAGRTTEDPTWAVMPALAAFVFLGGGTYGSQEFATALSFDGPYLHRTTYARADEEHPLPIDFLNSRPIERSWLREIPGDVSQLRLATWEPRKIYRETLRLIEELEGNPRPTGQTSQPAEADLAQKIREALGFDPDREIVSHLGEQLACYIYPAPVIPSIVLVIGVREGKALHARIGELLAKLEFSFNDVAVGNQRLHVLQFSGQKGRNLSALASPCWAITDDRLVLALNQSAAMQYLQARVTTQPAVKPIAEKPVIRDFLEKYKGPDLAYLAYANETETFTSLYYRLGMPYTVMADGVRGNPRSLRYAPLPPLSHVVKHLEETVSWSTVEGSVRIDHERSGLPVLGDGLSVSKLAMGIATLLPSLAKARELSKRSVCAANLKGIGAAIHTYASTNESRFPPDFKTLVAAQFLVPKQFRCPGSSAGPPADDPTEEELGACYIYIAGQNADSNPENVLVYEKNVNHKCEGGHVLFVDGHVEFLPVDQVKERVEKTRERLDNPIQKPPLPRKRPGRAGSMPAGR